VSQYIGGPCCGGDVPPHSGNPHTVTDPVLRLNGKDVAVRGKFQYALTATGDFRIVDVLEEVLQADGG